MLIPLQKCFKLLGEVRDMKNVTIISSILVLCVVFPPPTKDSSKTELKFLCENMKLNNSRLKKVPPCKNKLFRSNQIPWMQKHFGCDSKEQTSKPKERHAEIFKNFTVSTEFKNNWSF